MKLVATVALAAAAFVATWTLAFAHAEPARVKPGDGAVLNTPPTQIEITMSQEMAREAGQNDIDVFAAGKEVTAVAAVIDNGDRHRLSVPLPSNLAPGAYTVQWKTRSADDGDVASGSLSFVYDPARPASAGKEELRPDLLGNATALSPVAKGPSIDSGGGGGTSWVLLVAVAVAALVVGGGGTFILIQKRP